MVRLKERTMGWFGNTINKLNPAQPSIHMSNPSVSPTSSVDFRNAYDQIEVVRRCVDMIVSACTEVPFKIEPVKGHTKLTKLLNSRPNPFEDRVKFFRRAYLDLLMDGNTFIYYDGSAIYILPAGSVTIETDPKTFIRNYRYTKISTDGKSETVFPANEVIHIKLDSDRSIFRGKSPIGSLDNIISIYNSLLKFQKQFFKNSAIPGVVLSTDSVLNPKTKERILSHWVANYSTMFNGARTPAILDGGLKISPLSTINFQSLDFENSVDRLEQDMAKSLGVPYVLLKSGNNANISANQVLFYEHTILPMVSMFASAFEHFFYLGKIEPDKTVITALQPDLKTQTQAYVSLVNSGIITPDEARVKLGYEKLDTPETNTIRVPQNITGSATNPSLGGRPTADENEDTPSRGEE